MYHKVIVMQIKEKYALVMAEDGQILRVLYKEGMEVGDCIYILEDDILKKDFLKEENKALVIPFSERKIAGNKHKTIWKKMVAVAAACALFVTSFAVLSKPEKAYAMVSVDGEKTVELVLNQKNRVKEADSKNSSFTREEERAIKGEKVETIKKHFSQDLAQEGTIIVGYAFLEDESEEERATLQRRLEKTFGTDHLLYLVGDKEDVENAKKAGKSLGVYLAEQVLVGENFHKVVNEATEEEVLELLEKNSSFMENSAFKQTIQQKLSDYEDADELEKEDGEDRVEEKNEDDLEQQKERQEEREESSQTDEPADSVEEEEADETESIDEPAESAEERESHEMESMDKPVDNEGETNEETNEETEVSENSIEQEEED